MNWKQLWENDKESRNNSETNFYSQDTNHDYYNQDLYPTT
jgi:hypothetical protein